MESIDRDSSKTELTSPISSETPSSIESTNPLVTTNHIEMLAGGEKVPTPGVLKRKEGDGRIDKAQNF